METLLGKKERDRNFQQKRKLRTEKREYRLVVRILSHQQPVFPLIHCEKEGVGVNNAGLENLDLIQQRKACH